MILPQCILLATLAAVANAAAICPSPSDAPAEDVVVAQDFAAPPRSSSKAPAPTGVNPSSGCKCGYKLSAHNNAYFPYAKEITFGSLPNGALANSNALSSRSLIVTDDWRVGAAGPDGTECYGLPSNIKVNNGVLEFHVPGGQQAGGRVTGAEVTFNEVVTGGVFNMEAQFSSVPGTCQSIFTYAKDSDVHGDEQDIEILSSTIWNHLPNGTPPGVQLTNYDPHTLHEQNDNVITPFPVNPTTGFHNYTIAWVPGGTQYLIDGEKLDAPTKFFSVHGSEILINHWTNADPDFTAGPPTKDANMKVKSLTFYYQTGTANAYPQGCSAKDACVI